MLFRSRSAYTTGEQRVTKRVRLSPLVQAMLVIAAFLALVTTFNIFTAIHDAAEHGQLLPLWEPASWEYSSGIASLISSLIIYGAIRFAPPFTSWPKFALVHASGSFAFSSLHILLMNGMRVALYAALGRHYRFDEAGFWYEYRKDLIAYVILATIFWLFTRQDRLAVPSSSSPRMIDIREGKRLLRVPIDEIDALCAAGNYVEFVLARGQRALARQSLSAAQRELGDDFIRIHRSWAINIGHVRMLRSMGTGDYEVELASGLKAPLSRRFPDALARLRKPSGG